MATTPSCSPAPSGRSGSWSTARARRHHFTIDPGNLGLFQPDVSVIWDWPPHLSIMDFLIHRKPEAVIATGERT